MFKIHCVFHRENSVKKNIGSRDLIAFLQTVVSSINKIGTRTHQDRLFQEASRDENFHRLVYCTDVRWLSIGSCLTRFPLLFYKALEFLQARYIILRSLLIGNKMLVLHLEEIFWKFNEMNLSLQSQDMNIVRA